MRVTTFGEGSPARYQRNIRASAKPGGSCRGDRLRAMAAVLLFAMMPIHAGATMQSPPAVPTTSASKAALADHQLFVDRTASGSGSGLSWTNAFTSLQDALALARTLAPAESVEIWVAEGIYYPDVGAGLTNNSRNLSFQPVANVALYGGFAGGESTLEARDWEAHPTVLSGDIDGNDSVDADGVAQNHTDIHGNNSYHVVVLDRINGSATLDGFVITSGNATGLGQINGLSMSYGAGIHGRNSDAMLANLRIQGNSALLSPGGGSGGGIYAESDSARNDLMTLDNVQLIANAGNYGGGLSSFRTVIHATKSAFLNNQGAIGGAVHLNLISYPSFRDSVFRGNSASNIGGAFYGFRDLVALVNCEITGNHATNFGGAYYADGTTLNMHILMTNVVISGNSAGDTGGGIYREQPGYGSTLLYNSVIWNNQDSSGAGTASANHGGPGAARLVGVNSLVQGVNAPGTDNLDGTLPANDPLFQQPLDPATAPSTAGNFHPGAGSPVIDKGNNQVRINAFYGSNPPPIPLEGNVLTDLDGNDRIADGDSDSIATVDMGPYEGVSYTVGGDVDGLLGSGLVLTNNGGDDLAIAANGPFTFRARVSNLSSYEVTVLSQPGVPNQTCTISSGSGSVNGANVTNVAVNCSTDIHTVSATVDSGQGAITPPTQNVEDGQIALFTVTPDAGWHMVAVSGCDGTLSGTTYITGAITADCSISASFAIDQHTVTPSVVGGNGTIDPATPQLVDFAATPSFTLTPDARYHIDEVTGACGGGLAGNVYTTAAVSADCDVVAHFAIDTFTVGGNVSGLNGSGLVLRINGVDPLPVSQNGPFEFSSPLDDLSAYSVTIAQQPVSPDQLCTVSDGIGNLDGGDIGNVAIDCVDTAPHLVVSVSDSSDYVRYGTLVNYLVTVSNDGNADASGIRVSNLSPPQLDAALTTWTCSAAGAGEICGSGNGQLDDTGVSIPHGSSLSWVVTAPVLTDAPGATVDYTVDVSDFPTASATDSDILVILRTGFDTANVTAAQSAVEPKDACTESGLAKHFDLSSTYSVQLDTMIARSMIDTVLSARDSHASGFRIERLNLGVTPQIRIVAVHKDGSERASAWVTASETAVLSIAGVTSADASVLLLEGADTSLSLALPEALDASVLLSESTTHCD